MLGKANIRFHLSEYENIIYNNIYPKNTKLKLPDDVLELNIYKLGGKNLISFDSNNCIKVGKAPTNESSNDMIEAGCFRKSTDLKEVNLPKVTEYYGYYVFSDLVLNKFNAPVLKNINDCFFDNTEIKTVLNIPLLENIGDFAFYNSIINIKDLNIFSNLKNINYLSFGSTTFYKDTVINLQSIENISYYAFDSCINVNKIIIGNKIKTIHKDAFINSPFLEIVINKPVDSVPGAPWGATNAKITWNG